jgi:hypothetical protein
MSLIAYHSGKIIFPRLNRVCGSVVNTMGTAVLIENKLWFVHDEYAQSVIDIFFLKKLAPVMTGKECFAMFIDLKTQSMKLASVRFGPEVGDTPSFRELQIGWVEKAAVTDDAEGELRNVCGWSDEPVEQAMILGAEYMERSIDDLLGGLEKLASFKRSDYEVLDLKELIKKLRPIPDKES